MLFVPQKSTVRAVSNGGIVGAAAPWTAVTSGGTTNTYGSVVELISAANNVRDSWGIEIVITNSGAAATASESCCDILVGGATDDVLISSLICGYAYGPACYRYFFPVYVPAGLRIAAQTSSVRVSAPIIVGATLYGGSPPPFKTGRKVITYGTKTNNSRGVAITPTASGGAASVTQIVAATTEDHHYLIPGFQPATDTTVTPTGWISVGIGLGAATEERIWSGFFGKDTNEMCHGPVPMLGAFRSVPSGTRLSMLASNSGANDTAYDGLIYAVG